jgi:hypothetical protein
VARPEPHGDEVFVTVFAHPDLCAMGGVFGKDRNIFSINIYHNGNLVFVFWISSAV